MKYHKQLNMHRPEENIFGDCDRTVIACLLNKHPKEVPHWGEYFNQGGKFNEEKTKYLDSQGLMIVRTVFNGKDELQTVLDSVGFTNPDVHYMLTGMSETGVNHVVICLNGAIVWDTSQNNSGIIGPADDGYWHIEFLAPTFLRHEPEATPV